MLVLRHGLGLFVVRVLGGTIMTIGFQYRASFLYKPICLVLAEAKLKVMYKKMLLALMGMLLTLQSYSQINNFSDLMEVSNLSLQEMVSEMQYTWQVLNPEQDTSEKGFVTERYKFAYNKNNTKQIVQRSCRMELATSLTGCITNFICSDVVLLNRIIKNLEYNGYELKGKQGNQSMYEDGNNIIMIDTNFKNVNGVKVYNISVVLGATDTNFYEEEITEEEATEDKKSPLDALLAGRSKKNENTSVPTYKERKLLTKINIDNNCNVFEKIVLELVIDKNGKVVSYIRKSGSTDVCLKKILDEYIYTLEYTKDENATQNVRQILILNFSQGE